MRRGRTLPGALSITGAEVTARPAEASVLLHLREEHTVTVGGLSGRPALSLLRISPRR